MKTAEEWIESWRNNSKELTEDEFIKLLNSEVKQIQLDAMKEAADKANDYNVDLDTMLNRCGQNDMAEQAQWYVKGRNDAAKSILTAAEQLTDKDLI